MHDARPLRVEELSRTLDSGDVDPTRDRGPRRTPFCSHQSLGQIHDETIDRQRFQGPVKRVLDGAPRPDELDATDRPRRGDPALDGTPARSFKTFAGRSGFVETHRSLPTHWR